MIKKSVEEETQTSKHQKIKQFFVNLIQFIYDKDQEIAYNIYIKKFALLIYVLQYIALIIQTINLDNVSNNVFQTVLYIIKFSLFHPLLSLSNSEFLLYLVIAIYIFTYFLVLLSCYELGISSTQHKDNNFKKKQYYLVFLVNIFDFGRWIFTLPSIFFSYNILICGYVEQKSQICENSYNFEGIKGNFFCFFLFFIFILFQLLFELLLIYIYGDIDFISKNLTKLRFSQRRFLHFPMNNLITLFLFLDNSYLMYVGNHVVFFILLEEYIREYPIFSLELTNSYLFFLLCFEYANILMSCAKGDIFFNQDNILMIYLIFCSFIYGAVHVITERQRKQIYQINLNTPEIEPQKSIQFLQLIYQLYNQFMHENYSSYQLLMGILNFHQEQCNLPQCPCLYESQAQKAEKERIQQQKEENLTQFEILEKEALILRQIDTKGNFLFPISQDKEQFSQFILEFIDFHLNNLCINLLKSNKKSQKLQQISMQYWYFLVKCKNNFIKALNKSKVGYIEIEDKSVNFILIESTLTRIIENDIKQMDKAYIYSYKIKEAENSKNYTKFEVMVNSEIFIRKQKKKLSQVCQQKIEWFQRLINGYENMNEFYRQTLEIVRVIKKIEKEIEKQVQQSPNIIQYIKMLSIIKSKLLNDPISSSLHEQMIQDMQRKDKAENKETVNTIEILQGNVGNIIASFRKVNDQGVILSFSARTPELFGYDYNTFKSLYSIKQLLPAYICEIHDLFIERLVTTGEQKVMRNYRSAMAIDKQNYLFDIKLYINYNFQISSEFAFSALCLKQKIKQNKIVIDQQGYITGITEVFAEFTKCKHLDATIFNGLHICLFFPDLKSILMNQVQDLDEDLYFHKTQISFPRSQFIEEYFNNFKMQHRTWKQKSLNNKKILKEQIQLERILQNVLNYQMASQDNIMNFSSQHRIQNQSSNINPTPKYDAIVNIVSDKINLINGQTSKIFMISIESYQYISINSSLKNSSQGMTNTQNAMSIQTNYQYNKQSDTQLAQINEEEMEKQNSPGKSEQEEIEFPTKQEFNKKLNLHQIQQQTLNEYKKQSQNLIKTEKETETITPLQQDQQSQQENQQEFLQQNQSQNSQQNQQKDFKKLLEGEKSFINIQKTNSIVKKYSYKQNDLYKKQQSYYINEKSLTSDSEFKPGFTANLENISTNFQPNQNANLEMNDSSNIQFLYKESNIHYELDNNDNYYGNFNPQRSSISTENQDFNNKNQDDLSDHSNIQQEEIEDFEQLTQGQKQKLKKLQKKSNGSYNAEEIQGEEQASVSSSLNLRELGNLKNILNFIKNSQWPQQIKIIYASFLFQFLVFLSIFIYLYLKFNASFEDLHTCITKSSLEFLIMVPISLSNLLTSTYLLLDNNFIQPTNDPYYLEKYDKNYIQNYILTESSHNYNRFVSNINNITLVEQKYGFEKQMQKLVIDQIKTKDYTILNQFSLPFTELLPMFSEQMHQFTQKNQIQNLDFLSDSIYLYNNNLLTIQDNLITVQKEIDSNLKQILNDINKFNLQFFIIYVFLISVSYLLIFPGMRKIQQKLEKICLCISRMTETEAIQDIEMLNVLNYLLESKNEAYLRHNYNDPSQNNFMSKKLGQQIISSKISKTNKKYKSSGHLNDRIQNPKMNFNFFFFVLVFIFVIAFTLELVIFLFVKSRANTIDTTLQNKLNFVQSSSYLAQSVSFHRIQLIQNILTSDANLGDDYYINFQQKYYVNLDQYEEFLEQKSKQINQAYQGFQEFSRVYLQDGHTENFKEYLKKLNEGPICSNSEFLDDYQFELCADIYDGQINRGFSVQISTLINQIKNQDFDSYSDEQLKNYLESQTIINDSLYHILLMNILRKTIIKFEEEYKQIFDYYSIIQAVIYLVGGFFYIIILGFVMVHYISKIAKDYQDLKKSLQLIPFKRLSEDQTTFQLLKRIFDL